MADKISSKKKLAEIGRQLAIPVILFCVILFVFRSILLLGLVPSASMEPTLSEGSILIAVRSYGQLQNGDVIVFRNNDHLSVKRIICSPGDTVDWTGFSCSEDRQDSIAPDDCYIVMGDNRNNSLDSRSWDDPYVYETEIIAKVIYPATEQTGGT